MRSCVVGRRNKGVFCGRGGEWKRPRAGRQEDVAAEKGADDPLGGDGTLVLREEGGGLSMGERYCIGNARMGRKEAEKWIMWSGSKTPEYRSFEKAPGVPIFREGP